MFAHVGLTLHALHQAQFQCLKDRARAIAHAELGQDIGDVVLDRALGDVQRARDLLVGIAAGHQPQNLGLALGQGIGLVEAGELVFQMADAAQQAVGQARLHQ